MTVARSRAMYLPMTCSALARAGGASRMAASTPSIGRSTGSTRCGKLWTATGNSSLEFSSYQYVGLADTCRAA